MTYLKSFSLCGYWIFREKLRKVSESESKKKVIYICQPDIANKLAIHLFFHFKLFIKITLSFESFQLWIGRFADAIQSWPCNLGSRTRLGTFLAGFRLESLQRIFAGSIPRSESSSSHHHRIRCKLIWDLYSIDLPKSLNVPIRKPLKAT